MTVNGKKNIHLCRYDHYLNYGLVPCIFQIYRAMLLPIANTWMLWSLIHKIGLELSAFVLISEGVVLSMCYVLAVKMRFMLNVPVQLVTVVFSASIAAGTCGPSHVPSRSVLCMCCITLMQLFLGVVLPMLLLCLLDMHSGRSFMPHVQAKRWVLQT